MMSGTLTGPPIGISFHRIEADGRFTIAQRLRALLGFSFIITRGVEPCLILMLEPDFVELIDRWRKPDATFDADSRLLDRVFVGHAQVVQCDRQGRIVIPDALREVAHIEGEVAVVALRTRVELWDAETFRQYQLRVTEEQIQQSLDRVFGSVQNSVAA